MINSEGIAIGIYFIILIYFLITPFGLVENNVRVLLKISETKWESLHFWKHFLTIVVLSIIISIIVFVLTTIIFYFWKEVLEFVIIARYWH